MDIYIVDKASAESIVSYVCRTEAIQRGYLAVPHSLVRVIPIIFHDKLKVLSAEMLYVVKVSTIECSGIQRQDIGVIVHGVCAGGL